MPNRINELNSGMRENRITVDVVQITASLADNELIGCTTWLWPNMRLSIALDNRPYNRVRDVVVVIRNADNHEVIFHRPYIYTSVELSPL